MNRRMKFVKITEQMKEWSAALGAELSAWEDVTARRMFGMTVFFRKRTIFAALPVSRAFEKPTAVAFKLYKKPPSILRMLEEEPMILHSSAENPKWIVLELQDKKDLGKALQWYSLAYRACLSRNNSKV